MFASPNGDVAKDLAQRAIRVQSKARQLVSGSMVKVRTGRLRSSITWEIRSTSRGLVAVVGSNVEYAQYVHDGTGIYGPRGAMIRPVNKKMLSWKDPDSGQRIFAKAVRGSRPRPFLREALDAAL